MGFVRKRRTATLDVPADLHSVITWEVGHVRAAVCKFTNGSAEIMGAAGSPVNGISPTAHPDIERWYQGLDRSLTQAEDMTPTSDGHKYVPDYVTMCLPSELTRQIRVSAEMDRKQPARGTDFSELLDLLRRGYRLAQDNLPTQGARRATEEIIFGSVTGLSLDGQSVTDPLGIRGSMIAADFVFYLAPVEWIRAIEMLCDRLQVHLATLIPHHVAYASPLADNGALMILLDQNHTIVALTRRGKVQGSHLVELGTREIIDRTGSVLHLQGRQANALLRAHRLQELRDDMQRYVSRAFWSELRRWMDAAASPIQALAAHDDGFPRRVYLADLTRSLPEAAASLETPYWEQLLPFGCCPEVITLGQNHAGRVLDYTGQASAPGYLLLRTAAHEAAQLYSAPNALDRTLVDIMRGKRPPLIQRRSR